MTDLQMDLDKRVSVYVQYVHITQKQNPIHQRARRCFSSGMKVSGSRISLNTTLIFGMPYVFLPVRCSKQRTAVEGKIASLLSARWKTSKLWSFT